MTSDLDIYRSANELIKQHGDDAPIHAAMRAPTPPYRRGGGMRYALILPDGSFFGDSTGDNADKVAFCNACHRTKADSDSLFFVP